jgi:uncharacterized membrane-anchored protein YhcB (DUF1043 family)
MTLINCPDCGKEVSDKAEACPFCGYPFTVGKKEAQQDIQNEVPGKISKSNKKSLIIVGIIVGALILFAGIFFVIQKFQTQARIDVFNTELDAKITEEYDEDVEISGPYGSLIKINFSEPIVDISAIANTETEKANMDKLLTQTYRIVCYDHFLDRAELIDEFNKKADYANDKAFLNAKETEPICRVFDGENTYEFYTDAQGEFVAKKNGEIVDIEITN